MASEHPSTDGISLDRLIEHYATARHSEIGQATLDRLEELQRLRAAPEPAAELAAELLADDALLQKAIALYCAENITRGPWVDQGRLVRLHYLKKAQSSITKSGYLDSGRWCKCGLIAPAPGASCARCGEVQPLNGAGK